MQQSFLQFYEQISYSKLNEALNNHFLVEMPMRPEGDPNQYSGANPHKAHTAKDGYQGRTTQGLNDQGQKLSNIAANNQWDQAVAARPELKSYELANQALRADRKIDRAETDKLGLGKQDRTGSGRVVQTNRTDGEEDIEAATAGNRGLPKLVAQIDDLKSQVAKLRPEVKDWFDPRMMHLVKQLYAATELFMKDGRITGPKADEVAELHNNLAELVYKARDLPQPTYGV